MVLERGRILYAYRLEAAGCLQAFEKDGWSECDALAAAGVFLGFGDGGGDTVGELDGHFAGFNPLVVVELAVDGPGVWVADGAVVRNLPITDVFPEIFAAFGGDARLAACGIASGFADFCECHTDGDLAIGDELADLLAAFAGQNQLVVEVGFGVFEVLGVYPADENIASAGAAHPEGKAGESFERNELTGIESADGILGVASAENGGGLFDFEQEADALGEDVGDVMGVAFADKVISRRGLFGERDVSRDRVEGSGGQERENEGSWFHGDWEGGIREVAGFRRR